MLSCFHLTPERHGQTELLYQYRQYVSFAVNILVL